MYYTQLQTDIATSQLGNSARVLTIGADTISESVQVVINFSSFDFTEGI